MRCSDHSQTQALLQLIEKQLRAHYAMYRTAQQIFTLIQCSDVLTASNCTGSCQNNMAPSRDLQPHLQHHQNRLASTSQYIRTYTRFREVERASDCCSLQELAGKRSVGTAWHAQHNCQQHFTPTAPSGAQLSKLHTGNTNARQPQASTAAAQQPPCVVTQGGTLLYNAARRLEGEKEH
jgi:hypothetical protein